MDRKRLKATAATVAVAAVGAGAGIAATTHGGGGSSSAVSAAPGRPVANRPARPGGMPGGAFDTDLAAAASYLGTTTAKLQTRMRSGKTLTEIAKAASGKSTSGLIEAIVAAETKQIHASQKAGRPTAAEAKQMLAGIAQCLAAQIAEWKNCLQLTSPARTLALAATCQPAQGL